jgi:hypothetical protein
MHRFRQAKNDLGKVMKSLLTVLAGLSLALCTLILPATGLSEAGRIDSGDKSPEKVKPNNRSPPSNYYGMSAASAAVSLKHGYFVVGNDEDNILRVYSTYDPGVKYEFKLSEYFTLSIVDGSGKNKIDIEGATKLGRYIFWIGSHSRNSEGEERPARFRLFAHELKPRGKGFLFIPLGQPYTKLLDELINDHRFSKYKLAEASKKPPKVEGALSIEGLSASPDKNTLLIGFRNPITNNLALIVPLRNPTEVIKNGAHGSFGDPIELDIGGFGIRDIVWWKGGKRFIILAGPFGENTKNEVFRMYQWTGHPGSNPKEISTDKKLGGLNAEALVIHQSSKTDTITLQVLSDDEKDKQSPLTNSFRSVWIDIPK